LKKVKDVFSNNDYMHVSFNVNKATRYNARTRTAQQDQGFKPKAKALAK